MDWTGDLALKSRNAEADAQTLAIKAAALWGGLKQMLEATINLYNRFLPSAPNGEAVLYEEPDANARVVCKRCRTDAGNKRVSEIAAVTISFDSPMVTATYSDGRALALLTMGRDDKGYVVVLHDGMTVSMDLATEIILRPVLLPDYPEPQAT